MVRININRIEDASSPTSEQFAARVIRQVVRRDPPRYMTLGAGAWISAVLQCFPRWIVLWLMWNLVAGSPKTA